MKPKFYTFTRLLLVVSIIIVILPTSSVADTQATLRWDAASGAAPEGYRLYHRVEGQQYDDNQYTDTGSATTKTVSGLAENTTYFFVVRAYVGNEVSLNSNEVVFNSNGSTVGDDNPPSQPYTISPRDNAADVPLRAVLESSGFYDPDADDQHIESRWQIYRFNDDTVVLDVTSSESLNRLTVPASVLEPFTAYYWTVSYVNQKGARSTSAPIAHFTTEIDQAATRSGNLGTGSGSGGGGGDFGSGCLIQTLLNP